MWRSRIRAAMNSSRSSPRVVRSAAQTTIKPMKYGSIGFTPANGRCEGEADANGTFAPATRAGPRAMATAVMEALHKVKRPHPLAGTFNAVGTFTHDVHPGGNPDVGSPYKFTGAGKTKAMGAFSLTGWVQTPGFIASGTARG